MTYPGVERESDKAVSTRQRRGNEQKTLEGRPSEGLRVHRSFWKRQVDYAVGRSKTSMAVNVQAGTRQQARMFQDKSQAEPRGAKTGSKDPINLSSGLIYN